MNQPSKNYDNKCLFNNDITQYPLFFEKGYDENKEIFYFSQADTQSSIGIGKLIIYENKERLKKLSYDKDFNRVWT